MASSMAAQGQSARAGYHANAQDNQGQRCLLTIADQVATYG